MKKKKFILAALIGFLIVFLFSGIFIFIDTIAKAAIEKGATMALGVKTTLKSADVGVLSGTFDMADLLVENPDGYESPHFLSLGGGGVEVSLASLTSETVELQRLTLTGIDVNLEKRNGKANYKAILDNLGSAESGTTEDVKEQQKDGKRFIVKEIEIRDINVHVDLLPEGGELTKVSIPIPLITLTDVGTDQDKGLLLYELSGVLVKAIFQAAIDKGGSLFPADIAGELEGTLGELESLASMGIGVAAEAGEIIENIGEDIGEALEDAGTELEDTLKGLNPFGSDSSSEDDS